jgi:glycosyltransferase involved in cell wall biosynthesis
MMFWQNRVLTKRRFTILDAFIKFSADKPVELHIVGKIENKSLEKLLLRYLENDKTSYIGTMSYAQIVEKLQSVHTVVIPSLWIENYPNTALEGLITECIAIGSDRGGTKELIANDDFVFDVLNPQTSLINRKNRTILRKRSVKLLLPLIKKGS